MKNYIFYSWLICLGFAMFSCSERESIPDDVEVTVSARNSTFSGPSASTTVECGRFVEDVNNDPICESVNGYRISLPTELNPITGTTSLAGICGQVPVDVSYTICWGGGIPGHGKGMLISIVLFDISIPWDDYALWCPDLPMPATPQEQIEFMTNIRKEFAGYMEKWIVGRELTIARNPPCEDLSVFQHAVETTRIESGCFTWCEVVDFSPTELQPIVVKRVPCTGSKCCARVREYCKSQFFPYDINILSEEIILLDDNCDVNAYCLNPLTASCNVECEELF